MNVEQTTQLIQLILNSVLMMNVCALLLAGLLSRQTSVNDRVQAASREFATSIDLSHIPRNNPVGSGDNRQISLKKKLRQLQQRYRAASNSVLAINYALLLFVGSTLMLALRTIVSLSWLIPSALGLFSLGIGILLMGVVFMLYDLHAAEGSLWQEIRELLSHGRNSNDSSSIRLHRPKNNEVTSVPSKSPASRRQPHPKARVG